MKDSNNPNLAAEEDDSDQELYINSGYLPPAYGVQGQPEPMQPTHGTHQQPGLGDYEGGTWNHPMMPAPLQATHFQPPAQSTPQQPQTRQGASGTTRRPSQPAQTLGSRSTGSGPRPPRTRAAVPPSDPPLRVSANHLFPLVEEQIGEGVGSGRNWLVIRDGDQEPVLRAPLLIVRCKRDPVNQQNGSLYPDGDDIIPAGTSLTQVCQFWPRHVWGEMLRIFLSERWDAHRIWDLLPHNARNNAVNRPWNYLQAAMGRETDIMMQEDTGVRRVPAKKKTPTPPAEEGAELLKDEVGKVDDGGLAGESIVGNDDHPANDDYRLEDIDLSIENDLTIDQLIEITRRWRQLGVHAERAMLWVTYGGGSEREAVHFWRRRHNAWAQTNFDDFERVSGEPMGTREPIEMLRRIYMFYNPRLAGELLVTYHARADWHAWRNYAGVVQNLVDDAEAAYNNLVGAAAEEEAGMAAEDPVVMEDA